MPGGTFDAPPADQLRRKVIRAASFEYGYYRPMTLPTLEFGGLSSYRTPTRGLYFFGGVMEDGELWGTHEVLARDFYGGIRFEGPHWTDFTLQGIYETTNTVYGQTNGRGSVVYSSPGQAFSSFRSVFVLQYRVRSYDTFPGMPPSHGGFASDMFNLVFPFFWDKATSGPERLRERPRRRPDLDEDLRHRHRRHRLPAHGRRRLSVLLQAPEGPADGADAIRWAGRLDLCALSELGRLRFSVHARGACEVALHRSRRVLVVFRSP
jgi:hypothetical protein